MRFVLAGSSGFLGQALRARLTGEGHEVTQLVRRAPQAADQARWDPDRGEVDTEVLAGADAVVNLAGASIGRVPWTPSYRQTIRASRLATTSTLARALADLPEPPVFLSGSATGYYGKDRGDLLLDEDSPPGDGFLAELCRDWEGATDPAERAGVRVVHLRTSPVFDRSGGAFKVMELQFRLGAGGRLGSGRQYLPMICLDDWLSAVQFLAGQADARGPYNLTVPEPTTNAEFTKALGAALRRPTLLPVPAVALRTALGEFSAEMLGSVRLIPRRLLAAGFTFTAPEVDALVGSALHR